MKKLVFFAVFIVFFNLTQPLNAQAPLKKFSEEKIREAVRHNLRKSLSTSTLEDVKKVNRPWAQYETVKYLLFSDLGDFGSLSLKQKILENLPYGIVVIIYTHKTDQTVLDTFQPHLAMGVKLIPFEIPPIHWGSSFWTRDALPIPVVSESKSIPPVELVV